MKPGLNIGQIGELTGLDRRARTISRVGLLPSTVLFNSTIFRLMGHAARATRCPALEAVGHGTIRGELETAFSVPIRVGAGEAAAG
jgi:hypothetical protein